MSFHIFITFFLLRKFKLTYDDKTKEYKDKLKLRENELQALFENNNSYLWSIDVAEKKFQSSVGIENIFGYPREAFKNDYELWLHRVIPEDLPLAQAHYDRVKSGLPSNQIWRFRNSQEEIKWLDAWGTPIFTDGKVTHITGVAYDVTDRKLLEEKLKYDATHDHLTGLPNRTKLDHYIEDELKKNKEKPTVFAVLFLDLDRFKFVNDNYGHTTGDQILIQASKRIQSFIGETGIVTRHGGDEFVIVLPYKNLLHLESLVTNILQLFEVPFRLDGGHIITTSIGISLYPQDGENLTTLITLADQALYQAKSTGKNTYQFAKPIFNEEKIRKATLESELLFALKRKQLEVLYQPKVVLKTKEIYGVEALLRWNHPLYGTVSPDEFIPIAEEKGIIHDIGLWVFDEVMKQNKQWEAKGFNLTSAVNVSNLQFANPLFLDKIQQTLITNQGSPEKLTVEITESFMQNATSKKSIIKLKELGIEVSIDDFGTGYSALSTLSAQLVDEIKIDKAFIRGLTGEHTKPQIVKTILRLSEAFLSRTVAEGIESEEEAVILQEMGCLYGQGYLYSRPVKPEIIEELILNNQAQLVNSSS